MTSPLAIDAGFTCLTAGTHSFTLKSGATFSIYASPYTPAFCNWAFAYEHNEDRFNVSDQTDGTPTARNSIPQDVDIVMMHGPSKGILDWCPQGNMGCENLLHAMRRVKPKMHCFGHIHESNGIRIVDWETFELGTYLQEEPSENPYPEPFEWRDSDGGRTLAVNAAIMTGDFEAENAPWLVNLELPRSV